MPQKGKRRTASTWRVKNVNRTTLEEIKAAVDEAVDKSPGPKLPVKPETAVVETTYSDGSIELQDTQLNSLREACEAEGMTMVYIAQKLKELMNAMTPKWNPGLKRWDYFIDIESRRRTLDMLIKIYGGYSADDRAQNLTLSAEVVNILRTDASPSQVRSQLNEYMTGLIGQTSYVDVKPEEDD